jgi:hypothetical protein
MIWFKRWLLRWADNVRQDSMLLEVAEPKRSRRGNKHSIGINPTPRRVEHNYDDQSVINFKVYGANGGKIVETSRYDEKKDNESIRRYVIDENADLGESLSKIVTMEYLR